MAKPGPKPKPGPLRVLEGNPAHRPIPHEPSAEPGSTDPPEDLAPEVRAVWERLAPELTTRGLLAPRYADAFETYCHAVVACRRAARELVASGPVIPGRGGELVSSPAAREFRRMAEIIRSYAGEFGLTPAAVTSLGRTAAETSTAPARAARILS